MKVLQINTVYPVGSTGKIAKSLHDICCEYGFECKTAYRYAERNEKLSDTLTVSSWWDTHVHNRLARITLLQGVFSRIKTKAFLKEVDKYAPDIIHIHNIHGNYIHIKSLFKYIASRGITTVWTLHDCWSFTGNCPHFALAGCDQWKSGCADCPLYNSKAKKKAVRKMFALKKKYFSGVKHMTLVAPSEWLSDCTRESFLQKYTIRVINNGIDISVFKPTDSNFREKYGCEDKYILLGVAFGWGYKKGLDVFVELSKRLPPEYQIVLVGTDDAVDKQLPDNIISIHRTNNQAELAEIYSAANLFVQPTREENYPTVNMEALACGTPVLTFKTGGSPEIADDTCGSVVDVDDIDAMEREIIRICEDKPYSKDACLVRASGFDMKRRFEEYIGLYKSIL